MPTHATKPPEGTYTIAPAGTHVARIFKFINLGTRQQQYEGRDKKFKDCLVNFSLELPNEINEFTYEDKETKEEIKVKKPFAISREFTLSMGPKSNLRPFVEGVIGVQLKDEEAYAFDLEELVGKECAVTIVHKESKDGSRTYANIASVAPLMKGTIAPPAVNPQVIMDVSLMEKEDIDALPEWLRKKMEVSDEYINRFVTPPNTTGATLPPTKVTEYPHDEINPDDIPFSSDHAKS